MTVGLGTGQYVMADETYREIGRFGAANGVAGDLHEFLITPQGTALITAGREVPLPSPVTVTPSGSAAPTIVTTAWEGIVQEIDIADAEGPLRVAQHGPRRSQPSRTSRCPRPRARPTTTST